MTKSAHVQQDASDAVDAFVRTAGLLATSGVSMLDIAGSLAVVLVGAIKCLPDPVQPMARQEYGGFVQREPR